jgi:GDP-L-fucose synthase
MGNVSFERPDMRRGDQEVVVWGDGTPTREFLYVEDAAEGILLATESFDQSFQVNLGSSFEISIIDLVKLIAKITDFNGRIVMNETKHKSQPRHKSGYEPIFTALWV